MSRQQKKKLPHRPANEYLLDEDLLSLNPEPRIPVILCLDCSFSMSDKKRLARALEGLQKFCEDINKKEISRDAVELCIISYGGDEAQVLQDFATVDRILERGLPKPEAAGETPLADAVWTALDMLDERMERYKDNGITCYPPWLILMGDDENSDYEKLDYDDRREMKTIREKLKERTDAKHLTVTSVTVGDVDKMKNSLLRQLSPEGRVYTLWNMDFHSFFTWMCQSIERTSDSLGGQEIDYEMNITEWGMREI